MAKDLKVKTFSISTDSDFSTLEEFLSSVSAIENIVQINGKILVIYEE